MAIMSREEFLNSPDFYIYSPSKFAFPASGMPNPQDEAYQRYLQSFEIPSPISPNYKQNAGAPIQIGEDIPFRNVMPEPFGTIGGPPAVIGPSTVGGGLASVLPARPYVPTAPFLGSQPGFTPIAPTSIPGGTGDIIANLPNVRGETSGQSRIDPALRPYLQMALQRAEQLFLGSPQPSLYPGQMYVGPSAQTEEALQLQERAASGAAPLLGAGQQAYLQSLGQIGTTAAGGFLGGSPYREALIQAATRPLVQQYEQTVMPTIASGFSRAGRYGSGAMEQAQARATEAFGRSLGDVAATVAGQDYARERQLQQQAQLAQSALAQAAPSFFQASFLPSQALAQVGAAREQISAQPLQEAIQRYQFSQQLPYQQLQGFLSSVYGTPMGSSQYTPPQTQTNRTLQNLGLAIGAAGVVPEATRNTFFNWLGNQLG